MTEFLALEQRILEGLREHAQDAAAIDQVVADLYEQVSHYDWVGVYYREGDTLTLGPFRGAPSPHTTIPIGEGICGAAAREKSTVIVADVNADPRYLACSIETKSEIVVPLMDGDTCLGEIDIDSHRPDAFSAVDQEFLERIARALAPIVKQLNKT